MYTILSNIQRSITELWQSNIKLDDLPTIDDPPTTHRSLNDLLNPEIELPRSWCIAGENVTEEESNYYDTLLTANNFSIIYNSEYSVKIICNICDTTFRAAGVHRYGDRDVFTFKQLIKRCENNLPSCDECFTGINYNPKILSEKQIGALNYGAKLEILGPVNLCNEDRMAPHHIRCMICNGESIAAPQRLISRYFDKGKIPGCTSCMKTSKPLEIESELRENVIYFTKNMDEYEFKEYSMMVRTLTEQNYAKYKHSLNPGNLTRGQSDTSHHLDHIVSIRQCYEQSIPPALSASVDNLQFLTPTDNRVKGKKLVDTIPLTLIHYF